jgi:asparagine synthase (glutamine-hydrolysing)
MSLIAAVLDWNDPAPPMDEIGQLLSALPARAPDGRRFCRSPHALLGFGRRMIRPSEEADTQPFQDDQRRLCAVGDLRLDNRDELRGPLAGAGQRLDSDIAILVAAYERWGDETAERLVGDFAFVIWDGKRREAYAARDPFGVRSLVYRSSPGKLVFATDAAQLLSLPDTDRSPNVQTVVGYLAWTCPYYGPTFFRTISSVRPGHYLRATADRVREVEYFRPPTAEIRYQRSEDYEEHFRTLFRRAVSDRLDSRYPIVAHLSGGLDSSSIVCMAERIYREEGQSRVPFSTASALYPGQSCDETPFIDAVTRWVGFPSCRWDANLPSGREFSHPAVSIPGTSVILPGGSIGDLEAAASLGARVILSGSPGDFVTGEIGLFNELLFRGKWLTLLRQISCAETPLERKIRLLLLRRAIGEEAPRPLVGAWRARNLLRPSVGPPAWLRSNLRDVWVGPAFRRPERLGVGSNRLQQGIWSSLRWPWIAWGVDFLGSYAASQGIEMRFPFLDARLVSFMLAIPYEHRLLGGLRRWLHRKALVGVLPDVIAQRSSKPNFDGTLGRWGRASLSSIRELIEGSSWHSDRFVDQREARVLLNRLASKIPEQTDREGWLNLRAIVNIEAWHRAVFVYPRTKEILPMSQTPTSSELEIGGANGVGSEQPYEPPKLIRVGNVRSLLATGTASVLDADGAPFGDPTQ